METEKRIKKLDWLTKLRKKRKMTQKELAWKCNTNVVVIRMIEQGKFVPEMDLAYKISKVLDFDLMEDVFLTV